MPSPMAMRNSSAASHHSVASSPGASARPPGPLCTAARGVHPAAIGTVGPDVCARKPAASQVRRHGWAPPVLLKLPSELPGAARSQPRSVTLISRTRPPWSTQFRGRSHPRRPPPRRTGFSPRSRGPPGTTTGRATLRVRYARPRWPGRWLTSRRPMTRRRSHPARCPASRRPPGSPVRYRPCACSSRRRLLPAGRPPSTVTAWAVEQLTGIRPGPAKTVGRCR
jgi:hypothetical protein